MGDDLVFRHARAAVHETTRSPSGRHRDSTDWRRHRSALDFDRSAIMTQAVKRACDACHRRKVKCDGINPCRNCSQAQLSCTYNAVPQKKGPKGSRAKVISELRETQRATSLAAKVHSRMHGLPCSSSSSSGSAPTPGLLTSDLIKECTTFFFENMYRQLPILARRHID